MSAYSEFMKFEVARLEAANPGLDRKAAFKQAVVNWKSRDRSVPNASYPPIPQEITTRVDSYFGGKDTAESVLSEYLQVVGPSRAPDFSALNTILYRQPLEEFSEHIMLTLTDPSYDLGPNGAVIAALLGDSQTLLSLIQKRPAVLLVKSPENPLPYAASGGRWELVASILRLPLPISYDGLLATAFRVVEVQRVHPLNSNDITALLRGLFQRMERIDASRVYEDAAQVYVTGNGPNGFYDQLLPFYFALDQRLFQTALKNQDEEFFVTYQQQYATAQARAQGTAVRRSRSPGPSPPRAYTKR
jgi:hypothetical protein